MFRVPQKSLYSAWIHPALPSYINYVSFVGVRFSRKICVNRLLRLLCIQLVVSGCVGSTGRHHHDDGDDVTTWRWPSYDCPPAGVRFCSILAFSVGCAPANNLFCRCVYVYVDYMLLLAELSVPMMMLLFPLRLPLLLTLLLLLLHWPLSIICICNEQSDDQNRMSARTRWDVQQKILEKIH